eukprot:COSAG05_NODE_942_length_6503_cov_11.183948_4_plen_262_part_00
MLKEELERLRPVANSHSWRTTQQQQQQQQQRGFDETAANNMPASCSTSAPSVDSTVPVRGGFGDIDHTGTVESNRAPDHGSREAPSFDPHRPLMHYTDATLLIPRRFRVRVCQARGLPKMDTFGTADPFVVLYLVHEEGPVATHDGGKSIETKAQNARKTRTRLGSGEQALQQTPVVKQDLNPNWLSLCDSFEFSPPPPPRNPPPGEKEKEEEEEEEEEEEDLGILCHGAEACNVPSISAVVDAVSVYLQANLLLSVCNVW